MSGNNDIEWTENMFNWNVCEKLFEAGAWDDTNDVYIETPIRMAQQINRFIYVDDDGIYRFCGTLRLHFRPKRGLTQWRVAEDVW